MDIISITKANKAFTGLYNNWFIDEKNWYSENILNSNDDTDPDDIPIENLEDCDYKNLRILDEYFNYNLHFGVIK